MIYLFYGNDNKNVVNKGRKLVDQLLEKKPDASFVEIDQENFSDNLLLETISGQGIFENKYIVFLRNLYSDLEKEQTKIIDNFIKEIKNSDNIFVWAETGLNKKIAEKIKERSQKSSEINLKESGGEFQKSKKVFFNIFKLADAVANRDKKLAWKIFRQAIDKNIPIEEIHGVIFWQFKNLALLGGDYYSQINPSDIGMKPFVYKKTLGFKNNFKNEDEVLKKTEELIDIYHKSRRGEADMEIELERFILSL